jgi:hypothetical protein
MQKDLDDWVDSRYSKSGVKLYVCDMCMMSTCYSMSVVASCTKIPSWNTSNTSHWMHIVWVKRACIKILSIGERRYQTVLGSVILVLNVHDLNTSLALPSTVWYLHSPILRILMQALLTHTICIQWDVFDVFCDGIDHVMINPMVIYWQILDASLLCLYQRHY